MGLLIQNGTVVTAEKTFAAGVLIEGATIKDVRAGIDPSGHTVVDASGLLILPGGIDAHTHLDMPFGGTTSADHRRFRHSAEGHEDARGSRYLVEEGGRQGVH